MKNKISKIKELTLKDLLHSINNVSDSIDTLAIATKNRFDHIDEFIKDTENFKKETSLTLFNMDRKMEDVDNRLKEIEKSFGPLMRVSSIMQSEIRDLNSRVSKLEHVIRIK